MINFVLKQLKFIISLISVFGTLVGIASANFTLIFSLTTGIIQKFLSKTRSKKKKHNRILMLTKSKLDSVETLLSQALIDLEISLEKFNAIIKEKRKYEKMKKKNVRNVSEKQEDMRPNSVNSKNITS